MNYQKGNKKVTEVFNLLGRDARIARIRHHLECAPLAERQNALVDTFHELAPAAEVWTFTGKNSLKGDWQVTREMIWVAFGRRLWFARMIKWPWESCAPYPKPGFRFLETSR